MTETTEAKKRCERDDWAEKKCGEGGMVRTIESQELDGKEGKLGWSTSHKRACPWIGVSESDYLDVLTRKKKVHTLFCDESVVVPAVKTQKVSHTGGQNYVKTSFGRCRDHRFGNKRGETDLCPHESRAR